LFGIASRRNLECSMPYIGSTAPGLTPESNSVTVTGKVVDAACYMIHVAAAMSVSHMECSAACLARGVPLAIATDDGVLYFPRMAISGSRAC